MRAPQHSGVELDTDERDLIRSLILGDPRLVLDDDQVMRALIGAEALGARNVVDLRDRLVERMEDRLKKLARTNRSVIAAAYENVATTNQVHRAVLALIEPDALGEFLRRLTHDVPTMMAVEEARLCIEADVDEAHAAEEFGEGLAGRVVVLPEGTIEHYMAIGGNPGPVVLRPVEDGAEAIFGHISAAKSEALMRLDLGSGPGMLAFGAADPDRFGPDQGVDLLTFLAGVVERQFVSHIAAEA